jgi:hypothetical protein
MSVESINGKTGTVTLGASEVEAAPIPKLVEAGEVEGSYEPNCANGNVFLVIAKAAVTVKLPINVPSTVYYVEVLLAENATGGHALSTEGYALLGEAPKLNTAANAVNALQMLTVNGGASWYLVGLQAGKEGEKGTTGEKGTEGTEGFVPSRMQLPTAIKTYKEPSSSEIETRAVLAESSPRAGFGGQTVTLTSGTPVFVAIPVKAGQVIAGLAFAVSAAEGTPAERQHLWIALLNSKFEKLKVSADYTSNVNTSLTAGSIRALKFASSYEVPESGVLYGMVCEVMKATNPITLVQRESNSFVMAAAPMICGKGPAGQTTPEALPEKVTTTESGQAPWLAFV